MPPGNGARWTYVVELNLRADAPMPSPVLAGGSSFAAPLRSAVRESRLVW
jgi:hypothetical protein